MCEITPSKRKCCLGLNAKLDKLREIFDFCAVFTQWFAQKYLLMMPGYYP